MTPQNILPFVHRGDFRRWLAEHHDSERECWLHLKRGKAPAQDCMPYLDAVEEALCFGWIDSTLKTVDGRPLQRFGPRAKGSSWTELNKERCRRLEALGLMTESGRRACPDLDAPFVIPPDIVTAFELHPVAWARFREFPPLYIRVRVDTVCRGRNRGTMFHDRLAKLIAASAQGRMIGGWNDGGRLLSYP